MTQRQRRGLKLYNKSVILLKSHPGLLVPAFISTLVNTLLFGALLLPIIEHELKRMQTNNAPVSHFIWFYCFILLFFLLRNIINGLFNSMSFTSIQAMHQGHTHYIKKSFSKIKIHFLTILKWYVFLSCTGFVLSIFHTIKKENKNQSFNYGLHFRYATMLCHTIISNESCSPIQALKQAKHYIFQHWGPPPLRVGYSLMSIFFKYLLISCTPFIATLLFVPHIKWALFISAGAGLVAILCTFILEKTVNALIHQSLYQHVKYRALQSPLDQECVTHFYKSTSIKTDPT